MIGFLQFLPAIVAGLQLATAPGKAAAAESQAGAAKGAQSLGASIGEIGSNPVQQISPLEMLWQNIQGGAGMRF